ncbi:MAG: S8 family serine peptidase, partial [Clostridiales bacterium]|nr:S8 family serine peptidase [Clostridiales bacterium]
VNNKEDHGSHVAGIIGAGANNQKGITGIIWDSELICFDWEPTWLQQTFTDWSTETFIASGLINCVKSGAKVINFSLGTSGSLTDSNQTFSEDTINGWGYLASLYMASLLYQGYDFVVVQSAGNGASDGIGVDAENNGWFASVSRENCYDRLGTADDILNRIIIVGAVQQDGASYTQASFSNGGATVDICAPGVDIYSSVTGGFRGKYENMSGTSMASPIAAGVAGMVWAAAPGLSGAEVKAIVCGNGNTIHNAADNAASPNAVGVYRMVNAKLAVEAVLGTGQERDVTNELNLTGNAVTDESGAILLCPAVTNSNGSALFDDDLSDNFNISFDYKIGGGTGADGIVFAFFTDEIIPDMVGEYMMFNGNNGYGIEFDGYLNRNDSANPHIALIHLEVSNHLFAVDDVRAEDNEWHSVNVRVEGDSISVAVDGGIVIDYSGAIDKTNKCMYFAASTGSYTNDHYIKNVMLTELN